MFVAANKTAVVIWFLAVVIGITLIAKDGFPSMLDERTEIAATLAAEAGGEGIEGMRLVAETIRNRAKAQRKTPFQIVSAPKQYYGFTAKNRAKLYAAVKSSADKVADELMAGAVGNKTAGALYFINPKTEKPFRWCKVRTYAHGNHVFYK